MPKSPCSASTLFRTTLVDPVLVCGRELVPHVPRFANADHDNLAAPAQSFDDQLNRLNESAVKLRAHRFERRQFDVEDLPGLGQMIHRANMPRKACGFNQDCAPLQRAYNRLAPPGQGAGRGASSPRPVRQGTIAESPAMSDNPAYESINHWILNIGRGRIRASN